MNVHIEISSDILRVNIKLQGCCAAYRTQLSKNLFGIEISSDTKSVQVGGIGASLTPNMSWTAKNLARAMDSQLRGVRTPSPKQRKFPKHQMLQLTICAIQNKRIFHSLHTNIQYKGDRNNKVRNELVRPKPGSHQKHPASRCLDANPPIGLTVLISNGAATNPSSRIACPKAVK